MTEKYINYVLLFAGAAGTGYGMIRENNIVFIAGIVMLILGYLLLRKKLVTKRKNEQ